MSSVTVPPPYSPYGGQQQEQPKPKNPLVALGESLAAEGLKSGATSMFASAPAAAAPVSSSYGSLLGTEAVLAGTPAAGSVASAAPLSFTSAAAPYVAAPLAALTAYYSGTAIPKIAGGKDLSFGEQAALALPTFGASFLYNPVKKFFGGSSDPEELRRRSIKGQIGEQTGLGSNLSFTGAGGAERSLLPASYNVDFNSPYANKAVALSNPLAAFLTKDVEADKRGKSFNDLSGEIANTAMKDASSASDVFQNILGFANKVGVTPKDIRAGLQTLKDKKQISEEEFKVFNSTLSELTTKKG